MTINVARFNATTEEDILRQQIEDESTADHVDFSTATFDGASVRIGSVRLAQLHQIERLLLADYERTGAAHYQESAHAVRAIIVDAAAWRPEMTAAEMGRRGGSKRSVAKAIAGRLNGKKGGRPKKNLAMVGERLTEQPSP